MLKRMKMLARTLLMAVLLSGQLLVLSQAFALPHACMMDNVAPGATAHHGTQTHANPASSMWMNCHCPQGHHCGQANAALTTRSTTIAGVTNRRSYHSPAPPSIAPGHAPAQERPPPLPA